MSRIPTQYLFQCNYLKFDKNSKDIYACFFEHILFNSEKHFITMKGGGPPASRNQQVGR